VVHESHELGFGRNGIALALGFYWPAVTGGMGRAAAITGFFVDVHPPDNAALHHDLPRLGVALRDAFASSTITIRGRSLRWQPACLAILSSTTVS
jgi:hypothetical protein